MDPAELDYALLVNIAGGLMLGVGLLAGLVLVLRLVRRERRERPLPVDIITAARAPAPPPVQPLDPPSGDPKA